jgi:hypothetical protein
VNWIFYADDGIFYSENFEEFQAFLAYLPTYLTKLGIVVAEKKSFVSRLNGVWQRERIKFLGIVYEPLTGLLYSETRSGRKLLWTFNGLTQQSKSLMKEDRASFLFMLKAYLEYLLKNKLILIFFLNFFKFI